LVKNVNGPALSGTSYTVSVPAYGYAFYRVLNTTTAIDSPVETNINIQLFPNPVNGGELSIAGNTNITEVFVFNLMGQKIDGLIVNNTMAKLNTSNYSKGIYLLKISTKDGVINKRVVVE